MKQKQPQTVEAETVTNSEAIQSDDNNEKNIEKESGKSHPTAEYG